VARRGAWVGRPGTSFFHSLALYKSLFTYLLCVLSIPVVDAHYVQTAAVSGNVAHATRMVQLYRRLRWQFAEVERLVHYTACLKKAAAKLSRKLCQMSIPLEKEHLGHFPIPCKNSSLTADDLR